MQKCLILLLSLLVLSLSQETSSKAFIEGNSFKIISVSSTECLGDKIQFYLEFEDPNLIESSFDFKINLQSRNGGDTFFANCIFEVRKHSEQISDLINYEINKEEIFNSDMPELRKKYHVKKSKKLKSNKSAICTYDSIYKQGNYILKTNKENPNVTIENEIEIELIPCEFKIRRLSFRQVNSFIYDKEAKSLSFIFYGLTTGALSTEETISFWILLYEGGQKGLEPIEIKCSLIRDSITEDSLKDIGIKPVSFLCLYEYIGEVDLEEPYIQLYSSEYLTCFPTVPELLNPFLTDLFIKNGSLPNFSETSISEIVPVFIKEPKYDLDHITETKYFEITAEVIGNFEIGMNFNIPLISPPRGQLICEILTYEIGILNIKCSVDEELNSQPLIFEQIIIKVKGIELFVLPGMKLGPFATKRINDIINPSGEISGDGDSSDDSSINNKKIKYSVDDIYNLISTEKERLEISNPKKVGSIKYLSEPSSQIYDDTLKCINNSDIQKFYINANKQKRYIFVSVSNSSIELYKYKSIYSLNDFHPNYPDDNYYILSKGIGCFQIYYFEKDYFKVDTNNKLYQKSFNILNSKIYKFMIYCENSEEDSKITISIYSSENNFVKKLQIGEKYQDLKIQKKKINISIK
jgi:hypothetical protein